MPPTGFEPAIPASEQPQTHALDRAATAIGGNSMLLVQLISYMVALLAFKYLKFKEVFSPYSSFPAFQKYIYTILFSLHRGHFPSAL
jgi:hypothetical protein